mmetsp:Transcript_7437/g.11109  ORF Transcript_7437/g.11109 Transcript_7437/m.11109 type:complete len:496 (-) Transcript_7437:2436-3923(-)
MSTKRRKRTFINLIDDDDDDDVIILRTSKKRGRAVVNLVDSSSSSSNNSDEVIDITESSSTLARNVRSLNDIDQRFKNLCGIARTRAIRCVLGSVISEETVELWRARRERRNGEDTFWGLVLAAWEYFGKAEPVLNSCKNIPTVLIHPEADDIYMNSALEYAVRRLSGIRGKPSFDARIDAIKPLHDDTSEKGWDCGICFESFALNDVVFCQSTKDMHGLCKPCFRQFCIQCCTDKSLGSSQVECADPKCSAQISRQDVLACVAPIDVLIMDERDRDKALTTALGTDSTQIQCPCGALALISQEEQEACTVGYVNCPRWPRCKKKLCVKCGAEHHAPESCRKKTAKNSNAEKKTAAWLREMTKLCPNCRQPVEKAQGCNHVTCRCGAQWCYLCTGPFPNCHCGHFEEESKKEAARLQQEEAANAHIPHHSMSWTGAGGAFFPFGGLSFNDDEEDEDFIPPHLLRPPQPDQYYQSPRRRRRHRGGSRSRGYRLGRR